jgi:hypothetical protein
MRPAVCVLALAAQAPWIGERREEGAAGEGTSAAPSSVAPFWAGCWRCLSVPPGFKEQIDRGSYLLNRCCSKAVWEEEER